jgi:sec-independent protein translocase protein TatA
MLSGWDRPSHWLVLAVVVLVLFGYKKLPEMSRSVGRSLRIFKTEMKGMNEDDSARDGATAPTEHPTSAPPAAVQQVPVQQAPVQQAPVAAAAVVDPNQPPGVPAAAPPVAPATGSPVAPASPVSPEPPTSSAPPSTTV